MKLSITHAEVAAILTANNGATIQMIQAVQQVVCTVKPEMKKKFQLDIDKIQKTDINEMLNSLPEAFSTPCFSFESKDGVISIDADTTIIVEVLGHAGQFFTNLIAPALIMGTAVMQAKQVVTSYQENVQESIEKWFVDPASVASAEDEAPLKS